MDEHYKLQDIAFAWDKVKSENNWQKHGVSFYTACELFFDPFVTPFNDEIS